MFIELIDTNEEKVLVSVEKIVTVRQENEDYITIEFQVGSESFQGTLKSFQRKIDGLVTYE